MRESDVEQNGKNMARQYKKKKIGEMSGKIHEEINRTIIKEQAVMSKHWKSRRRRLCFVIIDYGF